MLLQISSKSCQNEGKYLIIFIYCRTLERLFWTIFITGGFSVSIYMINQKFEDDANNPIMTTIDTVDVTNVPFPAVTVLPGEIK